MKSYFSYNNMVNAYDCVPTVSLTLLLSIAHFSPKHSCFSQAVKLRWTRQMCRKKALLHITTACVCVYNTANA